MEYLSILKQFNRIREFDKNLKVFVIIRELISEVNVLMLFRT